MSWRDQIKRYFSLGGGDYVCLGGEGTYIIEFHMYLYSERAR